MLSTIDFMNSSLKFKFSASHLIYRWIKRAVDIGDVFQVPNGFGCGLGATQLVLYFIYRDRGSKKPTPEESVEMGLAKPNQNNKQLNANGV